MVNAKSPTFVGIGMVKKIILPLNRLTIITTQIDKNRLIFLILLALKKVDLGIGVGYSLDYIIN